MLLLGIVPSSLWHPFSSGSRRLLPPALGRRGALKLEAESLWLGPRAEAVGVEIQLQLLQLLKAAQRLRQRGRPVRASAEGCGFLALAETSSAKSYRQRWA